MEPDTDGLNQLLHEINKTIKENKVFLDSLRCEDDTLLDRQDDTEAAAETVEFEEL